LTDDLSSLCSVLAMKWWLLPSVCLLWLPSLVLEDASDALLYLAVALDLLHSFVAQVVGLRGLPEAVVGRQGRVHRKVSLEEVRDAVEVGDVQLGGGFGLVWSWHALGSDLRVSNREEGELG
jgi:hypothetical protein